MSKNAKQDQLDGMPQAPEYAGYPIEELRIGIIGLTNLPIDQRLEPGDDYEITIRGRFVRTEYAIRNRGRRDGGRLYAQERFIIRGDSTVKLESLGRPDDLNPDNDDPYNPLDDDHSDLNDPN